MGNVTIVGQATEIMCNNTQVPHGGHQNTKTEKPVNYYIKQSQMPSLTNRATG
uniref:Uncharacterized protein n=1 Tax=Anguilla anguilla TaxID=7936 RepID=A0A0E9RYD5_ANGAN